MPATLTKIVVALTFVIAAATSPIPVSTTEPETQAKAVSVLHRLAPVILPMTPRRRR